MHCCQCLRVPSFNVVVGYGAKTDNGGRRGRRDVSWILKMLRRLTVMQGCTTTHSTQVRIELVMMPVVPMTVFGMSDLRLVLCGGHE